MALQPLVHFLSHRMSQVFSKVRHSYTYKRQIHPNTTSSIKCLQFFCPSNVFFFQTVYLYLWKSLCSQWSVAFLNDMRKMQLDTHMYPHVCSLFKPMHPHESLCHLTHFRCSTQAYLKVGYTQFIDVYSHYCREYDKPGNVGLFHKPVRYPTPDPAPPHLPWQCLWWRTEEGVPHEARTDQGVRASRNR